MTRSFYRATALAAASLMLVACSSDESAPMAGDLAIPPSFVPAQPELFDASGAQPNTWVDFDLDGDLDLFVGFRGRPNRLYRNDATVFVDVAADVGLAADEETRAAAWGDYDMDGDLDLYVGFAADAGKANRLYRNDAVEGGRHFIDVAPDLGLDRVGTTRQPVFVDWDGDGDQDLFVAFRDQPNRLYRNDGGAVSELGGAPGVGGPFTDVTDASGAGDPRRTVGAVWFDMDGDGDLDLFTANQNGDEDGVYRNQGDGTFTDVAGELGMNQPGRTEEQGSVGVAVADYDNDGDLDLFVASYGPDVLWQNQGDGTFVNVAAGTPLASDHHSVAAAWGDYDNDGWVDLYVDRYLNTEAETPDALFRNVNGTFEEVTPPVMMDKGATHGVAWADFDMDGDLDLALANNSEPGGTHPLYVNGLPPARAARSLQVLVLDSQSRWIRAGAEITLRQEMLDGSAGAYQSRRLVESGGGYSSQGAVPVHFGIPDGVNMVSVTVAWFEKGQRRTATVNGVEPLRFQRQWLTLRLGVQ